MYQFKIDNLKTVLPCLTTNQVTRGPELDTRTTLDRLDELERWCDIRAVWRGKPAPGVIYRRRGRNVGGRIVRRLTRTRETHNFGWVSREVVYPFKGYNRHSMEKWLEENAKEEGWIVNSYLGSQTSVTSHDGKTHLHYYVTKYVDAVDTKDED